MSDITCTVNTASRELFGLASRCTDKTCLVPNGPSTFSLHRRLWSSRLNVHSSRECVSIEMIGYQCHGRFLQTHSSTNLICSRTSGTVVIHAPFRSSSRSFKHQFTQTVLSAVPGTKPEPEREVRFRIRLETPTGSSVLIVYSCSPDQRQEQGQYVQALVPRSEYDHTSARLASNHSTSHTISHRAHARAQYCYAHRSVTRFKQASRSVQGRVPVCSHRTVRSSVEEKGTVYSASIPA